MTAVRDPSLSALASFVRPLPLRGSFSGAGRIVRTVVSAGPLTLVGFQEGNIWEKQHRVFRVMKEGDHETHKLDSRVYRRDRRRPDH